VVLAEIATVARTVGSDDVQASRRRGSSHLQDFHLGLVEHLGLGAEVLVPEAEVLVVEVLLLGAEVLEGAEVLVLDQHQHQVLLRGR
jgi:hypothetical protein